MKVRHLRSNYRRGIVCLVVVLLFPIIAWGQFVTVTVDAVRESDGLVGSVTIVSPIDWGDVLAGEDPYELHSYVEYGVPIMAGEVSLGVADVTVGVKADPYISLDFSVTTPANAVAYTFTSSLLSFDELTATQGYAYASIGISTDGSQLFGGQSGLKAYKALYNGLTWKDMLQTPLEGEGTFDDFVNWETMPSNVSSMQAQFKFTLEGNSLASGSSYYEVIGELVPEPATIALLACGSLLLSRRRRRQ